MQVMQEICMMEVLQVVVIDLLLSCFCRIHVLAQDPCIDHVVLDEPRRSVQYTLGNNENEICDRFIDEGWYRVADNGTIPTSCPEIFRCGTMFPIWLQGTLPRRNQVGTMQACSRGFLHCCDSSHTIEVKNCESFFVYNLIAPPACPGRYCVDGPIAPCPEGESSDSGFVPCKPIIIEFKADIKVSPFIPTRNASSNESRLAFMCEMTRDLQESERNYLFDFVWLVDGEKVFEKKLVPGQSIGTGRFLHLKDWDPNGDRTLGFRIMCSLRARENETGTPSKYIDSKEFYAGVDVNQTVFHVNSGEDVVIKFKSTVPVSCKEHGDRPLSCNGNIELFSLKDDIRKIPGNCNASSTEEETKDICGIEFDGYYWNTYHEFTFKTLSTTDKRDHYTCTALLISRMSKSIDSLWHGYILPEIKINVVQKGKQQSTCYSYNDPQISSFDRRGKYDHPYVVTDNGEFVLYRNKQKPLQVNTIHKGKEGRNCAVMIKAGTDFFVIYGCEDPPRWIVRHVNCEEANLQVWEFGRDYTVTLPTGTKIRIYDMYNSWLNVYIDISPSEWNQTEGLCGSYDGNPNNDFTGLSVEEFVNKWHVQKNQSLFRASSRKEILKKEVQYCTCRKETDQEQILEGNDRTFQSGLSGKGECGWKESMPTCIPRKAEVKKCKQYERSKRETRDDFEFDVPLEVVTYEKSTQSLDWKNGWTYEKAKNKCISFAEKSKMFKLCSKLENVKSDSDLESCITDIKVSGTTNYLAASLDRLKAACLHEIETNTTFWVHRPDIQFYSSNATAISYNVTNSNVTESPVEPKFDEVVNIDGISDGINDLLNLAEEIFDIDCPDNCEKHGRCVKGICECNNGFTGDDCSIDTKKPPVLYGMMFGSLCDISVRACESVSVFGQGFYESDTVTCRISDAEVVGQQIRKRELDTTGSGSILSFAEVKCPIAELRNLKVGSNLNNAESFSGIDAYLISVSFDEQMYSETQFPIIVYNSSCTKCFVFSDESFTCKTREDVCIIDGACHRAESPVCKRTKDEQNNPNTFSFAYLGFALAGVVIAIVAGLIIYKRCFGRKDRYSFVSANENDKKETFPLQGKTDNTCVNL